MGWDWERGRLWDGIGNGDGFGMGLGTGTALAPGRLWDGRLWQWQRSCGAALIAQERGASRPAPQLPHGAHGCPTAPIAAPQCPRLPHCGPMAPTAAPTAAPRLPQLPHGTHCCPTAAPQLPHCAHSCPTAPIAAPRRPLLPHCTHRCPPAAPPHPHCSSPISQQHSGPMAVYGVHSSPPSPQTHRGGVGRGGGGNPSGGYPSGVVGVIPVGVIPSQWLWGAVCPPRPTPRPTQLKAVGALSAVCSPSAPQCNNRAPPNGSHPMGAMGPISPSLQHWGWVPPISPTPWVLWAP